MAGPPFVNSLCRAHFTCQRVTSVVPLNPHVLQGDDSELWWEASFDIPKGAVAVNFVVNCENAWDNNGGKDHKVSKAFMDAVIHGSMSHERNQAAAGMFMNSKHTAASLTLLLLPRFPPRCLLCWAKDNGSQAGQLQPGREQGSRCNRFCLSNALRTMTDSKMGIALWTM